MAISRIFDLSRRSLATYQKALDVTSHNIANAANPNYSRQRVNISAEKPELHAGFVWGTGIKIDQLQRMRNSLADTQIRSTMPRYYENEKSSSMLGQVESIFTEPSELGVSNLLNSFFNSWSELAVTPNSASLRSNVIQNAQKLSSKVGDIHSQLDQMKTDILTEYKSKVSELNTNLKNLRDLNAQIVEFNAVGNSANDLKDERDAVINEISKFVNVSLQSDDRGSINISIGGVYAADSSNYVEFNAGTSGGKLTLVSPDGTSPNGLNSGELNALSTMYSEKIPGYLSTLDQVITAMISEVNAVHSTGYTNTDPAETGINFFEEYTGGELKINSEITENPNKIAVSSDGSAGNGDLAVTLSGLSTKKVLNGNTLTESYSSMISGLGRDKNTADDTAESTYFVLEQLEEQKSSSSGVSIDEEMTNVIRFQRSYDAAAKLIKVADEMIQTLIQLV